MNEHFNEQPEINNGDHETIATADDVTRTLTQLSQEYDALAVYEASEDFFEAVKEKIGDEAYRYRLYHALIGSTPDPNKEYLDGDLPHSELSIIEHVRHLPTILARQKEGDRTPDKKAGH